MKFSASFSDVIVNLLIVIHVSFCLSLTHNRLILGEAVTNETIEDSTIKVYPDLTSKSLTHVFLQMIFSFKMMRSDCILKTCFLQLFPDSKC